MRDVHDVSRVKRTFSFQLRRLRMIRRQLDHEVTSRLVSALVLFRLDYCNAVFANLPGTTLEPLQRVQNAAARLIFNLRPRDHLTDAFLQLHWLPVKFRIVFKLCLLTHMALIGRAPLYMSQAIIPVANIQSRASLRSATSGDLLVPSTRLKQ